MTKNLKRLISAVLAVVMVLAMASFTAFAEDVDPTPTPTPTTNRISFDSTKEAHTYKIYQILTGDIATAGSKELTNVKWGTNAPESIKSANDSAGTYAASVAAADDAAATAKALVAAGLAGDPITVTGTEGDDGYTYAAQSVVPGYYLIIDDATDDPLDGKDDAYSAYVLKVVNDITVTPKTNVPSVVKKVKDANDSTDTEDTVNNWQDSADYDIGDTVPFQLTATLGADNLAQYEKYYIEFVDTMSKGLTFNADSLTVKIDNNDALTANTDYTVTTTTNEDGTTTIKVVIADVKALGANNDSNIVVEYNATLNNDAVIGSAGNENKVKLVFSNNPQNSGEGTPDKGETPEDKVIVFTYKTVINKTDGATNDPLKGAEFAIYKITGVTADNIGTVKVKYENAAASITGVDGAALETVTVVKDANGTTFTASGIDDGYYVLIETTTPSGYNTIDPIIFEVSATHDETADAPTLTDLNGNKVTGEIAFTADETAGSLTADVENNSGSTLPETGGMGTKIFYTLGGILVAAAGILLITKRRMRNA